MNEATSAWCQAFEDILDGTDRCDGRQHPQFAYHPYRRGAYRCRVCGAKVKLLERLWDGISSELSMIKFLLK